MSAVLSIILIVIAAVAAFFIGRWHGLSTGTKELTQELESKDKELDELKSGVNEHFDETARLFSNLTEEYKTLYQHLATGANKLSDRDFKLKLSAPVGADTLPADASSTETSNQGGSVAQANAAEVIDAEEHLTPEKPLESEETHHEEESFIRSEEAYSDNTDKRDERTDPVIKEADSAEKPDIDVEVAPPKDWADDDMDEDYHPNDSRTEESQFSDLADETAEKPTAPGYERDKKEEPAESQKQASADKTDAKEKTQS